MRPWWLLLLLTVPVHAQDLPGFDDGVRLRMDATRLEAGLDHTGSMGVTVTRLAQPTGTPLDAPRRVHLSVTGVPDGWAVGIKPDAFDLGPGEAGYARVTVAVTSGATRSTNVTVHATLLAASFYDEQTASAPLALARLDTLERNVAESLAANVWLVVLGVLALVVILVVVLVSQRRVTVRLVAPPGSLRLAPGAQARWTFRVENLTRRADTVFVTAFGVPPGWASVVEPVTVPLEAREQKEVVLVVTAPKDWDGRKTSLFAKAVSTLSPKRAATLQVEAAGRHAPRE